MGTPTLTPEGSQRGSGDEFVEVGVNDGGDESTCQERDKTEEEERNEGADSTPQIPPRPIKMAVYDPDADLLIINAPKESDDNDQAEHHFQVSSKSLASSSSVWKHLISSVSEPITQKDGMMMTLSVTNDIKSLTIFLKIVHLQFSSLPVALTFGEIYLLAQFSEKYAVHEMFLPFIRGWIEPFMPEELKFERKEWILIAWEFCLGCMFEEWLKFLCCESEVGSNGMVTYMGTEISELLPKICRGKYADYIERTRTAFISGLITVTYARLGHDICAHRQSRHQTQCNILKDGYLMASIKGLQGEGKWEWPLNAGLIHVSAREFKEKLLSMDSTPLPVTKQTAAGRSMGDHSRCGISFLKQQVRGYLFTEINSWEGGGRNECCSSRLRDLQRKEGS